MVGFETELIQMQNLRFNLFLKAHLSQPNSQETYKEKANTQRSISSKM